eukprot:TRINITY_DN17605_c0_g1_i1.p1 TRINITY_DN17605_c0_g1~~TRINITY_DN17605_c0_g1_i1.p1  ORF type:complete len:467 (+),score=60.79 TRINITY_DN17605_c0_g1_i1:70-1401(+)
MQTSHQAKQAVLTEVRKGEIPQWVRRARTQGKIKEAEDIVRKLELRDLTRYAARDLAEICRVAGKEKATAIAALLHRKKVPHNSTEMLSALSGFAKYSVKTGPVPRLVESVISTKGLNIPDLCELTWSLSELSARSELNRIGGDNALLTEIVSNHPGAVTLKPCFFLLSNIPGDALPRSLGRKKIQFGPRPNLEDCIGTLHCFAKAAVDFNGRDFILNYIKSTGRIDNAYTSACLWSAARLRVNRENTAMKLFSEVLITKMENRTFKTEESPGVLSAGFASNDRKLLDACCRFLADAHQKTVIPLNTCDEICKLFSKHTFFHPEVMDTLLRSICSQTSKDALLLSSVVSSLRSLHTDVPLSLITCVSRSPSIVGVPAHLLCEVLLSALEQDAPRDVMLPVANFLFADSRPVSSQKLMEILETSRASQHGVGVAEKAREMLTKL